MTIFSEGKITQVKGISDKRRLPRLGKIRLGFKLKKGDVEYPVESPFFVLPQEVARVYGFKDKEKAIERAKTHFHVTRQDILRFIEQNYNRLAEEIEVMLPVNDIGAVFPQAFKLYGSSRGVKCMGNGEYAMTYNEKQGMVRIDCPCEKLKTEDNPKGECSLRGHLLCLVPKISVAGIWQIDTGSYNSTVDINSGISYVEAMIGRFAMVPLVLRRIPTETHYNDKKQIHYTLQLILDPSIDVDSINALRKDTDRILKHAQYALPPADDTNPAFDKETEVIYEVEVENVSEDEKTKIIENIKQLRKRLPKDIFQDIRNKYNPVITDCTVEELKAFEAEVKDAIMTEFAKTSNSLFEGGSA